MAQTTTSNTNENISIESLEKSYQINNINLQENGANNTSSATGNTGSILVAIYNSTNAKRENRVAPFGTEQSRPIEYGRLQSSSSSESRQPSDEENGKMFSSSSLSAVHLNNSLSSTNSVAETEQSSNGSLSRFSDWTRLYLFGRKPSTAAPRISRPS
jgi:hypothetical protein